VPGRWHRDLEDPDPEAALRGKEPPMQAVRIAVRYTRYLLTSLAAVAFGMSTN